MKFGLGKPDPVALAASREMSEGSHIRAGLEGPPHPWDWGTMFVLALVHLGAIFAPFYFSWSALGLCAFLYVVSGMGITLGYHRLLTHRSYGTYRWLEYLIVMAGSLACQGGPVGWTAVHRLHHANPDRQGDPHSAKEGFWWAHLGWLLQTPPHKLNASLRRRLAPDLEQVALYRWLDRTFILNAILLGYALGLLGGWPFVFWGMFVRLTLVFHATWLVNSASHTFGYRLFKTPDQSTNCWWAAWLTFGEGWHNTHHAFPRSARHGLKCWEIDLTYLVISLMQRVGLAWDVKMPPKQAFLANPGDGDLLDVEEIPSQSTRQDA